MRLFNYDIILESPLYDETSKNKIILEHKPLAKSKDPKIIRKLERFKDEVLLIIHTVNDNEKWAALAHMDPPALHGQEITFKPIDMDLPNQIVLGMFGGYKAALVQTEMGGSSRKEIKDVLKIFPKVQFIVALGVAYGAKPGKYNLADVLVSKWIDGISNIKFASDGDNKLCVYYRDCHTHSFVSQELRHIFARGVDTWKAEVSFKCSEKRISNVYCGSIISGSALVNNREVRDQLRQRSPESIGGEMEGYVLIEETSDIQNDRQVGTVIIKGIADFGDGNKEKMWQFTAAMAAANYAQHKLKGTEGTLSVGKYIITYCSI